MSVRQKNVIVMDADPQILKGLVLLLENMRFNVISASSKHELENMNSSCTSTPDLLVLPLVHVDGISGHHLAKGLRTSFGTRIPAVLLDPENRFGQSESIHADEHVLPSQISPRELRKSIKTVLTLS